MGCSSSKAISATAKESAPPETPPADDAPPASPAPLAEIIEPEEVEEAECPSENAPAKKDTEETAKPPIAAKRAKGRKGTGFVRKEMLPVDDDEDEDE
mmetsp:Transcript_25787/g.67588  ORF Transcript_25787/g.67588 Transcript_25787/m.67588 type:complete len:98 (+) Transcript_25787:68-361(+)